MLDPRVMIEKEGPCPLVDVCLLLLLLLLLPHRHLTNNELNYCRVIIGNSNCLYCCIRISLFPGSTFRSEVVYQMYICVLQFLHDVKRAIATTTTPCAHARKKITTKSGFPSFHVSSSYSSSFTNTHHPL